LRPSVGIIIVNWNSGRWLKKCLSAVAAQTVEPQRVILVDNASSDTSLLNIEDILPAVEIIKHTDNLGFARANNLAINLLRDLRWTILLNPDAIPVHNWLETLIATASDNPEYSFFACKMIDALSPNLLDGCGDILHISGLAWRSGYGLPIDSSPDFQRECFSACAGAAMYESEAIALAGGFDERFFCYFEDVDLGFRLQLLGLRCLYVPDAIVAHAGSVSSGGKQSDFSIYHGHRNLVWNYVKNMPGWLFWVLLPIHISLNLLSIVWFSLRGKRKLIIEAKKDAICGLPQIWKERKRVQKSRRISPRKIWGKLDKRISFSRAPRRN